MNIWVRRSISLLEIGGGAVGIVALAHFFSQPTILRVVLAVIALAYYVFGIVAGLLLAESNPKGLLWSKIYQFVQMPLVSSPFIGYSVASGAYLCLMANHTGLNIQAYLGSSMNISLFRWESPWAIGINFIGLTAFFLLRAPSATK